MHKHLLEFCRLTGELLESEPVRMMGRWQHHGRITTLDHSLFVAYLSCLLYTSPSPRDA